MSQDILFFSCATKFYKNFLPLYVFFAEHSNPGSSYEFIVDNLDDFNVKHNRTLSWLSENGINILLRDLSEINHKPKVDNSIRFISEPVTRSNFVYIGDVDILILEKIYDWHKPLFDAGAPYSNVIRPDNKKLTGLHFVDAKKYYPLPDISDLIDSVANDEELLFQIVKRRGILYDNSFYEMYLRGRPVHGIHVSLNRLPFSYGRERVGWELSYDRLSKINKIFQTDLFKDFYKTLYPGSSYIILNLIFLSHGVFDKGIDYYKAQMK